MWEIVWREHDGEQVWGVRRFRLVAELEARLLGGYVRRARRR